MNPKNLRKWLLLDSQSTIDIFCNSDYLENVKEVKKGIILHTNNGSSNINKKGYLKNYGWAWHDSSAIANILALNNVKKRHKVTYDSEDNDQFAIHKEEYLIHFIMANSQNHCIFVIVL